MERNERGLKGVEVCRVLWLWAAVCFAWMGTSGVCAGVGYGGPWAYFALFAGVWLPVLAMVACWLGWGERARNDPKGMPEFWECVAVSLVFASVAGLFGAGSLKLAFWVAGDLGKRWDAERGASLMVMLCGLGVAPLLLVASLWLRNRAWWGLLGVMGGGAILWFCGMQSIFPNSLSRPFAWSVGWIMPGVGIWMAARGAWSLWGNWRGRATAEGQGWLKPMRVYFARDVESRGFADDFAGWAGIQQVMLYLLAACSVAGLALVLVGNLLRVWDLGALLIGFAFISAWPFVAALCMSRWTRAAGMGLAIVGYGLPLMGLIGLILEVDVVNRATFLSIGAESGLALLGTSLMLSACWWLRRVRAGSLLLASGLASLAFAVGPVVTFLAEWVREPFGAGLIFVVFAGVALMPGGVYLGLWVGTRKAYEKDVQEAERNAWKYCEQCGYDLTGTRMAGRGECPECGTAVMNV